MNGKAGFRFAAGSQGMLAMALCAPAAPCPPALAERMRLLHTHLVHIFQRVTVSYRRGAFERCAVHLRHFHEQLRTYLCEEGAELECYMDERLAGEPERLFALRQVGARMRKIAAETGEMLWSVRPGRLNPARNPGYATLFDNMARNLTRCIDLVELDFLSLCPPSFDHDAWEAKERASPAFQIFADPTTAEWIVLDEAPGEANSRAA